MTTPFELTTPAQFHAAATQMIERLRTAAHAQPNVWQRDAIQSPLGALVQVEYIVGANEAYRVNGAGAVCLHWQAASAINAVMRAAGYVRKESTRD